MNDGLGYRIRKIRESRNETMEEFGINFNPPASKGVVSNWENGYNKPNKKRLDRIAELGDITVNELLHGKVNEIKLDKEDINNNLESMKRLVIEVRYLSDIGEKGFRNEIYKTNEDFLPAIFESISRLSEMIEVFVAAIAQQLELKEIDDDLQQVIDTLDLTLEEIDAKIDRYSAEEYFEALKSIGLGNNEEEIMKNYYKMAEGKTTLEMMKLLEKMAIDKLED